MGPRGLNDYLWITYISVIHIYSNEQRERERERDYYDINKYN